MKVNASDYLANERTYLAYLRTAVALIGFGFVIARFGLFLREAQVLLHIPPGTQAIWTPYGVAMVALGIVIGLFGGFRYAAVARALRAGEAAALSVRNAWVMAGLLAVFGAVIGIVLYGTRH